jgi:hypothetical protein
MREFRTTGARPTGLLHLTRIELNMRKTIASAAVALSTAALTFGLAGAAHADSARHDRKRRPVLSLL